MDGEDELCLHPLFTRHLLAQSLGTDPSEDHRLDLGYHAAERA
jgi:hypothetical protein